MCENLSNWRDKYLKVIANPPEEGTILKPLSGKAVLVVEVQDNRPPFIYGKAFVPEIPSIEPSWYLQDEEHRSHYGWKCILMAKARTKLIRNSNLSETVEVDALRVVKQSQSGKSLLCEVVDNDS